MSQELDIKNCSLEVHSLKALRAMKGVTLKDMNEHLGLSVTTVRKYEKDPLTMDMRVFFRLSDYFGVSPQKLLEIIRPTGERGLA